MTDYHKLANFFALRDHYHSGAVSFDDLMSAIDSIEFPVGQGGGLEYIDGYIHPSDLVLEIADQNNWYQAGNIVNFTLNGATNVVISASVNGSFVAGSNPTVRNLGVFGRVRTEGAVAGVKAYPLGAVGIETKESIILYHAQVVHRVNLQADDWNVRLQFRPWLTGQTNSLNILCATSSFLHNLNFHIWQETQ